MGSRDGGSHSVRSVGQNAGGHRWLRSQRSREPVDCARCAHLRKEQGWGLTMMKKNEIFKNKEGYTDKVAGAAIAAADRPPADVVRFRTMV